MAMPGRIFAGKSGCAPGGGAHMSSSRCACFLAAATTSDENANATRINEAAYVRRFMADSIGQPEGMKGWKGRRGRKGKLLSGALPSCLSSPSRLSRLSCPLEDRVPQAVQVVAPPLVRAAASEFGPWDFVRLELRRFQTLIVHAEAPADGGGRIHDDDRSAAEIGVDVDERVEADFEAAFLARLANGRVGERLAAVDVAPREDPLAVAGLDGAADED